MNVIVPPTQDELLHGRTNLRVLLVDDGPETERTVKFLERAGFVVAGVSGGAAAAVQLRRTRPHVIVAGVNLRGITSEEFIKILGAAKETLPLILVGQEMSSHTLRAAAIAEGAFDYFQLPEEYDLLLGRLKQLAVLSQAIERLRSEADRDFLTGLSNRRRFRTALGQEVERWRRYQQPCSLIIADVDHLKKINDTHGHSAGDIAIRHVAHCLTALSRDNDTAARLGGEEFALLLAATNEKNAITAGERLRKAVSAESLEGLGKITISLGIASCPVNATNERALYAASDAALYTAKRNGRDRCCIAEALTAVQG